MNSQLSRSDVCVDCTRLVKSPSVLACEFRSGVIVVSFLRGGYKQRCAANWERCGTIGAMLRVCEHSEIKNEWLIHLSASFADPRWHSIWLKSCKWSHRRSANPVEFGYILRSSYVVLRQHGDIKHRNDVSTLKLLKFRLRCNKYIFVRGLHKQPHIRLDLHVIPFTQSNMPLFYVHTCEIIIRTAVLGKHRCVEKCPDPWTP